MTRARRLRWWLSLTPGVLWALGNTDCGAKSTETATPTFNSSAGGTSRAATSASGTNGGTSAGAGGLSGSNASASSSANGSSSSPDGAGADAGGGESSDAGLVKSNSGATSSNPAAGANPDGGADSLGSGWHNVAIGGGGFVSGIVFSPAQQGLAYARTDVGGFYRWDDAESVWIPLTDSFPASQGNLLGGESIAPDPTDPNIVYAAAGMYLTSGNGAILRSTDQGATWTVNPIPVAMGGNANGRGMGERLAVDPNNPAILLFGTRNNGLYRSADSGASWSRMSFPATGDANYGLPVVVFNKSGGSPSGSASIFVAAATRNAGSNLYSTNNGGATWTLVEGGPSGLMVHHAAMGSDGTLWLAYSSDYGPFNVLGEALQGQVWKYGTATGIWTNVTPESNWGGMAGGLSVDAQDPLHAIVSTLDWYAPDRLLATVNGGATWDVVAQPPVAFNPVGSSYDVNGAQYWLVGGPFIGTGATNWVEAVALDPFDSNRAMYGTGAGIWVSSNLQSATGTSGQGVAWTFLDNGLEETVPIYLGPSVNGAFLGAIGDLGGMRNTSLTTYSSTGEYSNPVDSNTNGLDFAEGNLNFVVRVGNSGRVASDVAYSMTNGQTWTPCAVAPAGYTTANEMNSVAVAADGSRFLVSPFAGFGSAAVTTTNCASWTPCAGLPSGAAVASDRVAPGTFYATSGGTLYVSTDGGVSFSAANTFAGGGVPRAVFGQSGEVWVAADGGALYRFTGAGASRTLVTTVASAAGVGFGKAAPGQTHPATFIIGTVAGQYGFFRSDDGLGAAWTQFNDPQHQFGWLQGNYIAGDENVYARAYLTTSGRGYVYYDAP